MIKHEGAQVPLFWPGGASAGTGIFHETGEGYPNDYPKFFNRFNGGKWLILEGSAIGGSLGVRAQVGGGEGHVETTLSPLLMRAAEDPANPWGITPADISPANFDLTLLDFQALYGKAGLRLAQSRYGMPDTPPVTPPVIPPIIPPVVPPIIPPSTEPSEELLHLRSSIKLIRSTANKIYDEVDLPSSGRGKYADGLRRLIALIDSV